MAFFVQKAEKAKMISLKAVKLVKGQEKLQQSVKAPTKVIQYSQQQ
jgi:hypothetical protein